MDFSLKEQSLSVPSVQSVFESHFIPSIMLHLGAGQEGLARWPVGESQPVPLSPRNISEISLFILLKYSKISILRQCNYSKLSIINTFLTHSLLQLSDVAS